MSFNNGYERRKFEQEWEKERKVMVEAGMNEESINKMLEYDKTYYNSRRRYEEHRISDVLCWDNLSAEEDFDEIFDFMDQISDRNLYFSLKSLKYSELELIKLYVIKNMGITEISRYLGKSKSTISKKISRIITKIKNNSII